AHVVRASAAVEYHHLLVLVLLVEAIGQCGGGGLVDDAAHLQARDLASLLGGLPLGIIEIGGDGNDCLTDGGAQVILRGLLHFLQDHRTDLLRRVRPVTHLYLGHATLAAHHFVGHPCNFL